MEKDKKQKKVFLKPGKNIKEERMNFVRYWAEFVKNNNDEEWSKQQNVLINSQLKHAKKINLNKL